MKVNRVAIFISTSRNTEDVFMKIFDINFKYLKELELEIYVGCNNSSKELRDFVQQRQINLIDAMFESNWNDEIDSQVQIMSSKYNISSFMLLLDDFLILNYNKKHLYNVMEYFVNNNLSYVRLKERLYLTKIFNSFINNGIVYKIRNTENYYNSLQIAFWKVDSFRACTKSNAGDSIWKFEWLVINENWSVQKSVIQYDHVIEKGRVRQSKLKLLSKFGVSFSHERAIYYDTSILHIIKAIKFFIFGYLFSSRP